jgi:hypothetical protein
MLFVKSTEEDCLSDGCSLTTGCWEWNNRKPVVYQWLSLLGVVDWALSKLHY